MERGKSRMAQAREQAGMTQKELAARLGIGASTLNGYEKGRHAPKPEGLAAIASLCGVTADFLLGLTDQPTDSFTVQISQEDPQIQRLLAVARTLNAQGLERLISYGEDLSGNPAYHKG